MSEDSAILVGCLGVLVPTVAMSAYRSRKPWRALFINLLIWTGYTFPLLYGLEYHSSGGVGLVWVVYLLFATGLHWLVIVVMLIRSYTRKQRFRGALGVK